MEARYPVSLLRRMEPGGGALEQDSEALGEKSRRAHGGGARTARYPVSSAARYPVSMLRRMQLEHRYNLFTFKVQRAAKDQYHSIVQSL